MAKIYTLNKNILFKNNQDTKLIVFIHGITGSEETWSNSNSSFFFPEELHNELIDYSTYVFSYDSNKLSTSTEFYKIIESLNSELEDIKLNQYDEVIFVAHSMGGLIAKSFLVNYLNNDILNKVNKVILLGTPNNGSFFPKIISHLSRNNQFKYLKPIHDNIFLQQLTDMWINLFGLNGTALNSILCYCGYEKEKTYLKVIVPLGDVSSPCCSQLNGFNKNHLSISKPLGKKDEVYVWVKEKILYQLTEIEKFSKVALSNFYQKRIQTLEDEVIDMKKKISNNYNRGDFSEKDLLHFNTIEIEKNKLHLSYEKLNTLIEEQSFNTNNMNSLLEMLNNNDIEGALRVFSENEIDLEIEELNNKKEIVLNKILINIELYKFKNDYENIERYYTKLFKIERSESYLLDYANFLRYNGNLVDAKNLYLEIKRTTSKDITKSICLNNLGTMSYEYQLSYENSLVYLKEAYTLYDNLFESTKVEKYLAFYIQSKLNYHLFELKNKHNYQNVLNEINNLLTKLNLLDYSSEKYFELKFMLLNNIFSIIINYNIELINGFPNIIKMLDEITNMFVEYEYYFLKEYAEMISTYYYNKGAYYGTKNKNELNKELFSNANRYFEEGLKIRESFIPKNTNNLQQIIRLKKSIGVLCADSGNSSQSLGIFIDALSDINNLILNDLENKIRYLEEKVEIIICILSVDIHNSENFKIYEDAIKCLNILNTLNPNANNILYCRLILMVIPSIDTNEKRKELYDIAMKKLSNDSSTDAIHMKKSLIEFKENLKF